MNQDVTQSSQIVQTLAMQAVDIGKVLDVIRAIAENKRIYWPSTQPLKRRERAILAVVLRSLPMKCVR